MIAGSRDKIKKTAETFRVDIALLEKHLNALDLASKIQKFEDKFFLTGGTAAQFYLTPEFQRTSTDVDLITNYSLEEFEKIIREFCKQNSIDYPSLLAIRMTRVDGIRYFFPVDLYYSHERPPYRAKIEIVSKIKEKFIPKKKEKCTLYDWDFGDFTLLEKEDLFAKKFVTLDLDKTGLRRVSTSRKNIATDMGKQIYDLKRLYDLFGEVEFNHIGKNIYEQFQNDIDDQEFDCSPNDCIENVCKIMFSLSCIETNRGNNRKNGDVKILHDGYKNIKTFLPDGARLTISEWSALGWNFEHFLKSVQLDRKYSTNERALKHLKSREKYRVNDEANNAKRLEIIEELSRHRIPKPYKDKPLDSLVFKKELLEGELDEDYRTL